AGYWNRSDESAKTFTACLANNRTYRYLRTGDLGFLDQGQLFVTGRLKELIIINGVNHYPVDIEATVQNSHPGLRGATVASFSIDGNGSEELVLVQEVGRCAADDLDQAADAIRYEVIEGHDLAVRTIVFVANKSIPKTTRGKIQRSRCREQFLNRELKAISTKEWDSESAGWEKLAGIWAEVLKRKQVGAEENFFELGGHSLLATQVVSRIRQVLGVELPVRAMFEQPTIAGLVKELEQRKRGGAATVGAIVPVGV